MGPDEKIHAHLVSIWRESQGLFALGGREGMLFLTERHIVFVHKTGASMNWWKAITQRQVVKFIRSKNTMIRHDGYGEDDLADDLADDRNVEVPYEDVVGISSGEKAWGSVLHLEYRAGDKKEKHQYSVAQDWVKYPAKEPTKYMKVDWEPFVEFVNKRRRQLAT